MVWLSNWLIFLLTNSKTMSAKNPIVKQPVPFDAATGGLGGAAGAKQFVEKHGVEKAYDTMVANFNSQLQPYIKELSATKEELGGVKKELEFVVGRCESFIEDIQSLNDKITEKDKKIDELTRLLEEATETNKKNKEILSDGDNLLEALNKLIKQNELNSINHLNTQTVVRFGNGGQYSDFRTALRKKQIWIDSGGVGIPSGKPSKSPRKSNRKIKTTEVVIPPL